MNKVTFRESELFSSRQVMHKSAPEFEDIRITASEVHGQFFVCLAASIPNSGIVEVLDMSLEVLLQLLGLEVVISHEVGIHLDQVIPFNLPYPHGDEVRSMPTRPVEYRCFQVGIAKIERLWRRCLEQGFGVLDRSDLHLYHQVS